MDQRSTERLDLLTTGFTFQGLWNLETAGVVGVTGGDAVGAMCGGLDAAEAIRLGHVSSEFLARQGRSGSIKAQGSCEHEHRHRAVRASVSSAALGFTRWKI